MKIVDIREAVVPIASDIRNAYIDFSKMNVSVVALVTDVIRDGKPVIGYGFNSNGRYAASGLLRERFLPRLREAAPQDVVTEAGDNLDPAQDLAHHDDQREAGRPWRALGRRRGGRHGGVGRGRQDRRQAACIRHLAERHGDGNPDRDVFVYAAGGYYYPGKDHGALQDEMRRYLDLRLLRGQDEDRRRGPGRGSAAHRGGARRSWARASRSRSMPMAASIWKPRFAYAKALQPYDLFWYEEAGDPLDYALQAELAGHYDKPMATGENLFSHQDARNLLRHGGMRPDRDWLQFDCALSYGLVEYMRTLALLPEYGFSARNCIPHGGHQLSLEHRGGAQARRQRSISRTCSRRSAALPTASPWRAGGVRLPDDSGHRLRGQGRADRLPAAGYRQLVSRLKSPCVPVRSPATGPAEPRCAACAGNCGFCWTR